VRARLSLAIVALALISCAPGQTVFAEPQDDLRQSRTEPGSAGSESCTGFGLRLALAIEPTADRYVAAIEERRRVIDSVLIDSINGASNPNWEEEADRKVALVNYKIGTIFADQAATIERLGTPPPPLVGPVATYLAVLHELSDSAFDMANGGEPHGFQRAIIDAESASSRIENACQ
jgi:hypothetical protein